MKEKIKEMKFKEMSKEEIENFLNDLLELNDDDLVECVIEIIDNIDIEELSNDDIPKSYDIIFNNHKIKEISENLLSEYDNNGIIDEDNEE